MLPNILTDFNFFIDTDDFVGVIKEITPPKITKRYATVDNGGMSGIVKVPVGYEEFKAMMKFDGAPAKLIRLLENNNVTQLQCRIVGTFFDPNSGTTNNLEMFLTGTITELDEGSYKRGDNSETSVEFCATYYRRVQNGAKTFEANTLEPFKASV